MRLGNAAENICYKRPSRQELVGRIPGLFHQIFQYLAHFHFFLLFAGFIDNNTPFMHHEKPVAVFHRIAQIVRHHNRSQMFFTYDLIRQYRDFSVVFGSSAAVCSSRIREINRCHGRHEECQRLPLSAGKRSDLNIHLIPQAPVQRAQEGFQEIVRASFCSTAAQIMGCPYFPASDMFSMIVISAGALGRS